MEVLLRTLGRPFFLASLVCALVASAALAQAPRSGPRYRPVIPGVDVTIAPDKHEDDTNATHDVVDILASVPNLKWQPKHSPQVHTLQEMATATIFRRPVWYLEFTFRPVRMMWVDFPQETGKMQRKLVWYMVYRVKNNGKHLNPKLTPEKTYTVEAEDTTDANADLHQGKVFFFPHFVLEAPEYRKAYLDRIVPVAVAAIQQKEDPNRRLLNSAEISLNPIPLSTEQVDNSVWGVAVWEEVDPRIDLFSVYVEGLTNAYKWIDPQPGQIKHGDPPNTGKTLVQKNLVLNFWRPGDEALEDQRIIHYGMPEEIARKYHVPEVDYLWVYR